MSESSDDNPGASSPSLEKLHVTYGGPENFWGDAATVAGIHRTNRLFDFLETLTLAVLASVVTAMTAFLVMYSPDGRETLVLGMAITGWILALSLGGFAAFRIRVSKSGMDITGQQPTPQPASKSARGRAK